MTTDSEMLSRLGVDSQFDRSMSTLENFALGFTYLSPVVGAYSLDIPPQQYPGQALVCELYRLGGIRSVEIGSVMFGTYQPDGSLKPSPMELVRLAIPRRVYTQSHMEFVAETFEEIMRTREQVRGYRIIKEPKFLRHFTAHFDIM